MAKNAQFRIGYLQEQKQTRHVLDKTNRHETRFKPEKQTETVSEVCYKKKRNSAGF